MEWGGRVEVDSGGGHKGPWRMNASEYDYVDDPAVALDARGSAVVAWVDQARKDVLFQAFEPGGRRRFEQPVNVSRSPTIFSWLPRVVVTLEGAVAILWQEIVFSGGSHGGEIFFSRSTDGGRSFSEPLNLSRSMGGDGKGRLDPDHWDNGSLDLVVGPDGGLHAAWTEYDGVLWVSSSRDGGRTFSGPMRIWGGGAAKPARGPALAAGAGGRVYLAWAVGEDPSADIQVAMSEDRGRTFSEPRSAVASVRRADAPKLAVDSEGSVHLVYSEEGAGRGEPSCIRYTRAAAGTLGFEEPRDLSTREGERRDAGFPQLAIDGEDRLFAAWELAPRERSLGMGFASSSDKGRSFSAPSVVPGTSDARLGFNGGQQGLLMRKLAAGPGGGVVLAHSTYRPGEESHVWLIRGQPALMRSGRPRPRAPGPAG